MSSNQNDNCNKNVTNSQTLPLLDVAIDDGGQPVTNDNATGGGTLDTTPLVALPDVVRYIGATLRRHGVPPRDIAEAIADVQTDAIEAARTKRMPAGLAEWKALAATIAARRATDRRRKAKVRKKYDAGLCEEPDAYASPILDREQRDPVDTKRYVAILKDLFDSGQMPEDGAEILWGEAEGVPHAELGRELGVSENTVRLRLFRMRALFRAKLVSLGILTLMLLVLSILLAPVGDVATPPPRTEPAEPAPTIHRVQDEDAGTPDGSVQKSTLGVKRNRAVRD